MAEDEGAVDLVALAEQLYGVPPERFTAQRQALAAAAPDRQLAAAVKKLRKPTVAAWAVNHLVRRETGQIDQVLGLGESLREAAQALDGEELRALTRQRRQLTTALAGTARQLAREAGVRLSDAVVEQVEGMLTAAMLDPVAAQALRTGRVLTAFTSTGVAALDPAEVVAVPEALDVAARPGSERAEESPVELRVVEDRDARLAAEREAAEHAVEESTERVAAVEEELARAERAVQDLNARRLQLQGEAEELRRRLAAIEDDVDAVDEELEDAEGSRAETADATAAARSELDRARAELDRLRG